MTIETKLNYQEFLKLKQYKIDSIGKEITNKDLHPKLFDFQKDIVRWVCKKGRGALFIDTGLGKTFIQLEWARLMGGNSLIVAPLSVARQTIKEGKKIDTVVNYVRNKEDLKSGINITNYEIVENFIGLGFTSIVLDESSILKSISGKTRKKLIESFKDIKYRLCCTATPAPNDYIELGNHSEFLGICSRQEMLAMFFINANKEYTLEVNGNLCQKKGTNKGGQEWRLKHHAEELFFEWMAKWSITMTKPSDLQYEDKGFILPELNIKPIFIKSDYAPEGKLFFDGLHGLKNRIDVRRASIDEKLEIINKLINIQYTDKWLIWCGLDEEQRILEKLFKNKCVSVYGGMSIDDKEQAIDGWNNDVPIMITKAKVLGMGMNFQHCSNMIFFGLNDSWETYY